jgi:DNA-binding NarL/FixJ family response regulator
MEIAVAVVEDDVRIRRTLEAVIAEGPGLRLAGAYASGEAALKGIPAAAPEVVIMDVNLPGLDGIDCVMRLSRMGLKLQIIMLTVSQNAETLFRALAAGAHGYLVKPVSPAKLLEAIHETQAGGSPMSGTIARLVVDTFRQPEPAAPEIEALSEREYQVLELLAKGYSYKEIATEIGVAFSSVATYIRRVYEKLHVRSRREAIACYLKLP